jgi:uncharacterized protein YndB with AHSA1/START domain
MTTRHAGRLTRLSTTAALTAILGVLVAQPSASGAARDRSTERHHPSRPDVTIDATAPVITRDDIIIRSSPRTVWRLQTDVDNWPSWQPGVSSAHIETPGRLRVGSEFRWLVEGLDVTSTVKQVEPERRIVWGGPGSGITAVHVWTFTPRRDGVHVHTEESWSGAPVEADVAGAQAALDASLDAWLHNLKNAAEASRR